MPVLQLYRWISYMWMEKSIIWNYPWFCFLEFRQCLYRFVLKIIVVATIELSFIWKWVKIACRYRCFLHIMGFRQKICLRIAKVMNIWVYVAEATNRNSNEKNVYDMYFQETIWLNSIFCLRHLWSLYGRVCVWHLIVCLGFVSFACCHGDLFE